MATNRNTPTEIRFCCSHCYLTVRFVSEVRKVAVGRMERAGWAIELGSATCPKCISDDLTEKLRKSTAPAANGATPIKTYPAPPYSDDVATVRPIGRCA